MRIAFLGMGDNRASCVVRCELEKKGVKLDFVILQDPDLQTQWRRFIRKLRLGGVRATINRIFFAMKARLGNKNPNKTQFFSNEIDASVPEYRVRKVNAEECWSIIRKHAPDVVILCTDEMIGRKMISLPKIGCLNAHPGWIPQYRGLGSLIRQARDGYRPAISVHLVDEGVDTGPLLLRREVDIPITDAGNWDTEVLQRAQARMFVETLELLGKGPPQFIDTFLECSNMTRGIPAGEAQTILLNARNNLNKMKNPEEIDCFLLKNLEISE